MICPQCQIGALVRRWDMDLRVQVMRCIESNCDYQEEPMPEDVRRRELGERPFPVEGF